MTIRRVPTDFSVEEIPSAGFERGLRSGAGDGAPAGFGVWELTKTSLTTPEAVQRLARALGVQGGQVGYAGLKDKHAVTTQRVSVPGTGKGGAGAVDGPGWSARLLGWSEREIAAEAIEGNRFTIVVRDLTAKDSAEMERRAGLLCIGSPGVDGTDLHAERGRSVARAARIVNYFGDQRFGSARHGAGFAARYLVRGEFEQALRLLIGTPARKDSGRTRAFTRTAAAHWGRWAEMLALVPGCPERAAVERLAEGGSFRDAFAALPMFTQRMCVEAFQSHLWNAVARRLAERIAAEAGAVPPGPPALLTADDDFGKMVFPHAAAVDEHWRAVEVPMLGPETVLHEPWKREVLGVLSEECLALGDLRVPALRRPVFGEAMRPLIVEARGFEIGAVEPDDLGRPGRGKRTIRFELPRGAYATVVLRALGQ